MCGYLLLFVAYNAVIWLTVSKHLLTGKTSLTGDLARIGYLPGMKSDRPNVDDLPKHHLEIEDYHGQKIDLLTFGDSFSNGGGGGRNRYYQDYIASLQNMTVLNIEPYLGMDFITLVSAYCDNGFLDRIRPRIILVSSSEKFCIERLGAEIDWNRHISLEQMGKLKHFGFRQYGQLDTAPSLSKSSFMFINEGNFRYPLYNICYQFSPNAFFSKTYYVTLDRPFFSNRQGRKLLFYRDDIRNIGFASPDSIKRLNDNLNRLADKLARKGIRLYFMPCVDKYNLYSEFIVHDRFPKSVFFEELRPLPKKYTLIDTKAILLDELKKGEQDVYYADDTHWSWKASQKIFESVKFN
ncbi:MAG TPA: hypothetical protein VMJ66_08620 [Geobacteraceae bacterium]|nr:hypothetical protein [Geobacteraceae bacterium]